MPCGVPQSLVPQHRVEDRQKLAHTGDDCDLFGLASSDQTAVENLDRRVVLDGHKCGHVNHRSHVGAAAPNAALARAWPRVIGQRCHADKLGYLPPIKRAEFWEAMAREIGKWGLIGFLGWAAYALWNAFLQGPHK